LTKLVATAGAAGNQTMLETVLSALVVPEAVPLDIGRLTALGQLSAAFARLPSSATGLQALQSTRARAAALARDPGADEALREAAVRVIAPSDVDVLGALLDAHQPLR